MYRFSDFRNHNRRTIVIAARGSVVYMCVPSKYRACLFDNFKEFFKHQTSKMLFDIINVSSFSKYVDKSYFLVGNL